MTLTPNHLKGFLWPWPAHASDSCHCRADYGRHDQNLWPTAGRFVVLEFLERDSAGQLAVTTNGKEGGSKLHHIRDSGESSAMKGPPSRLPTPPGQMEVDSTYPDTG